MKKALLLNIIDPTMGGVLIQGDKGTAKSTAVRSLVGIMPNRKVNKGCFFNCEYGSTDTYCTNCRQKMIDGSVIEQSIQGMRVVELPLSATEDRVAGTLDIEKMLKDGKKRFEPGILASANGNILYVDEINLLDDHLVDMLLDSAAMGVNYVEREGVSYSHPARFVLVGTMNPEEGNLRPQLLDRFGLSVDVRGESDPKAKAEVIRRRLEFDMDPKSFIKRFEKGEQDMRNRILRARGMIREIAVDESIIDMVVETTSKLGIDGHRADITLIKAAKANAALENRDDVIKQDLIDVAHLALAHRMRRRPFEDTPLNIKKLTDFIEDL